MVHVSWRIMVARVTEVSFIVMIKWIRRRDLSLRMWMKEVWGVELLNRLDVVDRMPLVHDAFTR